MSWLDEFFMSEEPCDLDGWRAWKDVRRIDDEALLYTLASFVRHDTREGDVVPAWVVVVAQKLDAYVGGRTYVAVAGGYHEEISNAKRRFIQRALLWCEQGEAPIERARAIVAVVDLGGDVVTYVESVAQDGAHQR